MRGSSIAEAIDLKSDLCGIASTPGLADCQESHFLRYRTRPGDGGPASFLRNIKGLHKSPPRKPEDLGSDGRSKEILGSRKEFVMYH